MADSVKEATHQIGSETGTAVEAEPVRQVEVELVRQVEAELVLQEEEEVEPELLEPLLEEEVEVDGFGQEPMGVLNSKKYRRDTQMSLANVPSNYALHTIIWGSGSCNYSPVNEPKFWSANNFEDITKDIVESVIWWSNKWGEGVGRVAESEERLGCIIIIVGKIKALLLDRERENYKRHQSSQTSYTAATTPLRSALLLSQLQPELPVGCSPMFANGPGNRLGGAKAGMVGGGGTGVVLLVRHRKITSKRVRMMRTIEITMLTLCHEVGGWVSRALF
ncbi:hypothetical protein C8J57DRAFT_1251050 [Mycena rebaudengoi]|nr:hypothetical protein C8J57DRAFT_1251050 [Mycena rebaudengoi]